MSTVLVIGAGGVSSVCVHKMAMNAEIFADIHLASRTKSKCDAIAASVKQRTGRDVATYEIDAEEVPAMINLIKQVQPSLVVNLALPYQDLPIMDACLAAGVNYLDTANYEPKDQAKFEYSWQWAYHDRFKEAGLMALLGSGFDPGVTSVFTMWLKKHKLKTIRQLDILDCNGGDHGQHFATNFNPEINIREVTAPARHWENGEWVETPAMATKVAFDFEAVGPKNMYLMYHEELESLAKFVPELERARFWMTFGDAYITHLTVLQNVGMTSIEPIRYQGQDIIPLQFLAAVLPKPETLGETTKGNTNIGVIATGEALGGSGEKTFYINNICSHEAAYEETGNQAVSYTTGVPAMIGSAMVVSGKWAGQGVFNMEEMDPDPFMDMLNSDGLPWQVTELQVPVEFLMDPRIAAWVPVALLAASATVMNIAWYWHLKAPNRALWLAILLSWGIAFIEYALMVPANRIGAQTYSLVQLKTIAEVCSLVGFVLVAWMLFGQKPVASQLAGFALIAAGAFLIFRGGPA